jgi:hypothetical protein
MTSGHLGLGPETIRNEDLVVIFQGGEVPCIIRKIVDAKYRLVGAAYIHGIVDGEFLVKAPETKTFELV